MNLLLKEKKVYTTREIISITKMIERRFSRETGGFYLDENPDQWRLRGAKVGRKDPFIPRV